MDPKMNPFSESSGDIVSEDGPRSVEIVGLKDDIKRYVETAIRCQKTFSDIADRVGSSVSLGTPIEVVQLLSERQRVSRSDEKGRIQAASLSPFAGIKVQNGRNVSDYGVTRVIEEYDSAISGLLDYSVKIVGSDLDSQYPQQVVKTARLAISAMFPFDLDESNLCNYALIYENLLNSLLFTGKVRFFTFACAAISSYGYDENDPSSLVSYMAQDINLVAQLRQKKLQKMLSVFNALGIDSELIIVLGDADEEGYIFPSVGYPPKYGPVKFVQRREKWATQLIGLKNIVDEMLIRPDKNTRFSIVYDSWVELYRRFYSGGDISTALKYGNFLKFDLRNEANDALLGMRQNLGAENSKIQEEVERMREIISASYEGVFDVAGDAELASISSDKFVTYAMQGVAIAATYPFSVLLQNERPRVLRTEMLNSGVEEIRRTGRPISPLPAIYLYGE